jgi:alkyl hydroperoxide reductase subunit AhpF
MANLLDDNVRQQVAAFFENLDKEVQVLFFGSDDPAECQHCAETRQLLEEVIGLSEKLHLKIYNLAETANLAKIFNITAVPSFVIAALEGDQVVDFGIRYKGIPAGHEFTSLVNSLLIVSRRDSGLSEETRDYLKTLDKPVFLQVFVTPT